MIRRFETYAFVPGATDDEHRRVAAILAGAGEHIPEVLLSRVGWNVADSAADLVWEQAYASPQAYRRYMAHPYHADLIDRHILADSPERVVETIRGAGLFGYHCREARFALGKGTRAVLLAALAPDAEVSALVGACDAAASHHGALVTSFGANTMAATWFDAETTLPGPPPRWSHIWEGGFADTELATACVADTTTRLDGSGVVIRTTSLVYSLEP